MLISLFNLSAQEPLFIDRDINIECINDDKEGRYSSFIHLEHTSEDGIIIHTQSQRYDFLSIQDHDMKVQIIQAQYYHEYYADLAGLWFFRLKKNQNGSYRLQRTKASGRERDQQIELNALGDFGLMKFLIPWEFYHRGVPQEMALRLYEPSRNMEYRMGFQIERLDIEKLPTVYSQYQFPEDWNEILQSKQQVYVAQGKLLGFPGTVYPHPFIILMDLNYNVLLEWGGKPDKPYFTRYIYQEDLP